MAFRMIALVVFVSAGLLPAVGLGQTTPVSGLTSDMALLASAQPDECFNGVGNNSLAQQPPCDQGIEKVNEAYVWGLALAGDKVFFGTVANTHCLVIGTYLADTSPVTTDAYVCEFGSSPVAGVPPELGDFRPPSLYMYDRATETLTDLAQSMPAGAQGRLSTTLGIRAAGTADGVVLMAGIALGGGVNFFAFADDGTYLDSDTVPDYTNIRKFKQVEGELYAGLGFQDSTDQVGHIVRWIGNTSNPIDFELVGVVGSEVADLAPHNGRLYVTTWPDDDALAGLYMSPLIGSDGQLTTTDAGNWSSVFSVDDYEPNPISAATYGLGALASFDGYLFWGTMHVPGTGTAAHVDQLAPGIGFEIQDTLQAERSISIFRGRDFDTTPVVDVLYGYEAMPVMDPTTGDWQLVSNNLDKTPVWGAPGFNNVLNNYTWTMAVYDDRLWVGTMDVGGLLAYGSSLLTTDFGGLEEAIVNVLASTFVGADLWFFVNADSPALPESMNGAGNPANYGFRTMETDGDALIIGTANPMNLLTSEESRSAGVGGWELLSMEARPANTSVGSDQVVDLGQGVAVEFCEVTSVGITGVVAFGDTADEALILSALSDALAAEDVTAPLVSGLYTVGTTAGWDVPSGCDAGMVMHVTFDAPLYNPKLFLLFIDPISGASIAEEITISTTPLSDNPTLTGFYTDIRGEIPPGFVGSVILISERPPARVFANQWWALLLLTSMLWLFGTRMMRQ